MPFDTHYDPSIEIDQHLTLNVVVPDGGRFTIDTRGGDRVIDSLKAYGFPLRSECFGEHGRVDSLVDCLVQVVRRDTSDSSGSALAWNPQARNPKSRAGFDEVRPLGRLVMSADLDGMEIRLGNDVLAPQTFWAAG